MDKELSEIFGSPAKIFKKSHARYKRGMSTFGERVVVNHKDLEVVDNSTSDRKIKFKLCMTSETGEDRGYYDCELENLSYEKMRLCNDQILQLYSMLIAFYHNGKFAVKNDIDEIVNFLQESKV